MTLLGKIFFGDRDDSESIEQAQTHNALLLDVRTPGEFASDSIEGSINIPYDMIDRQIEKHQAKRDLPIIVYCHSGPRASAAKQMLEAMGYTNVYNAGTLDRMKKIRNAE